MDTALFNNAKIYVPNTVGNGYGNDHAYVKKYVIGSPADNGGLGSQQSENLSTYMLRLPDVYFVYANAILGNNPSTTDADALKYFNAVRIRAGIAPKSSITYRDILQEKKIEFAFEGHTWYDWKQWYYFDPTDALQYYSTQNRGLYNISYNNGNPFITFLDDATQPFTIGERHYSITANNADLPYPESDLLIAPGLSAAPVPFDFAKVSY